MQNIIIKILAFFPNEYDGDFIYFGYRMMFLFDNLRFCMY